MSSFSKITGIENNSISVGSSSKIHVDCAVEFKKFHNGSGGDNNLVQIGDNCNIRLLKVSIQGIGNKLIIGDNCKLNGALNIGIIGTNRTVTIGSNCTINGAFINCRDEDIVIGNDCLFSNEIKIRSSDAHKIFDAATKEQINSPKSPVTIGNHVWVGQGVFIGKNAAIPDGCVVGTRAVITKKFEEPNCIIGGIGGRVIRQGIYWEQ
ncbi:acyltransferase [Pseudomonas sp. PSKL.D1]|uniref:acyltransferase n=1 Tax=Pseudomonas sp. PSKL.D1 TaxID=3029060 RepID=UPI002380EB9B|nr:hypothetical protein [Pseudomonas sp. PSKL.D1]WDY56680.1 hypothetical protein PVV54_19125 [Pseudomonas sp. PSKL.D1]